MSPGAPNPDPRPDASAPADSRIDALYALLHEVIDPEVGVNIVDLGLIYDVWVDDDVARVRMTLTTPGCPLSGYMEDSIHQVMTGAAGLRDAEVEIVWEPAWSTAMMTDEAKRQLGWIR